MDSLLGAAAAALAKGDVGTAGRLIDAARARAPCAAAPWVLAARLALATGDRASAGRAFDIAAALEPGFASIWLDAGLALGGSGGVRLALRGRRCAPDAVAASNLLGIVAAQAEATEIATQAFAAAAILDPGDAGALENIGKLLLAAGRASAAAPWSARAVDLQPERHSALVDWHEALRQSNRIDAAWAVYWRAEATAPAQLVRANAASDRLISLGRQSDAMAATRAVLAVDRLAPVPPLGRRVRRPKDQPLRVGLVQRREFTGRTFGAADLPGVAAQVSVVDIDDPDLGRWRPALDLLVYVHLLDTEEHHRLARARALLPETPLATWYIDNHHHYLWNEQAAGQTDLHFPAHPYDSAYLLTDGRVGAPVPLGVIQWTRDEAERCYRDLAGLPRDDRLQGHFGYYALGLRRNRLAVALAAAFGDRQDVRLGLAHSYHVRSPRERFAEWRRHKVSLTLPLVDDLPYRVFDALLAGQIPIVPETVRDLDAVIPREDQAALPIIRFCDYTVDAVDAAMRQALAAFDAGGEAQAARRHAYVRDHHMFEHRLARMIQLAAQFGP